MSWKKAHPIEYADLKRRGLTGFADKKGYWLLPKADPANYTIRLRGNPQVQKPEVGCSSAVSNPGIDQNSELKLPPLSQNPPSILLKNPSVSNPLSDSENITSQQELNSLEGSRASTPTNSPTPPTSSGLSNSNGEDSGGIWSELLDKF